MRSFLIGYVPASEEDTKKIAEEAWVHINLWEKKEGKTLKVIIDFGIMVKDVKKIKAINIYSPFDIEEVNDISALLMANNQLISAVFNENYKHNDDGFIIKPHKRDPFVLSLIDKEDIKNDKNLVTLDTKNVKLVPKTRSYFRIRLTLLKNNCREFIFNLKSNLSPFSDFFTSTEIIDFRLNDIRSFGSDYRCFIGNKAKLFHIHSVRYLILRVPSEILIHHGDAMKNSRYLETSIWKDYGLPNDMIAYHFHRKAERIERKKDDSNKSSFDYKYINHFSILARFQCQKPRYFKIIVYVIVITLLLGSVSGLVGNVLHSFIQGLCK
jgi:hypothetical protein